MQITRLWSGKKHRCALYIQAGVYFLILILCLYWTRGAIWKTGVNYFNGIQGLKGKQLSGKNNIAKFTKTTVTLRTKYGKCANYETVIRKETQVRPIYTSRGLPVTVLEYSLQSLWNALTLQSLCSFASHFFSFSLFFYLFFFFSFVFLSFFSFVFLFFFFFFL